MDKSSSYLLIDKKKHYPKGIENLGLSCYMNSLLQCLFNIKELRNYFIEELEKGKLKRNKHPVSYYFAEVMYNLLYSDSEYIAPNDFKKAISEKNSLFKDNKAADATDLFRILIDSFLTDFNSFNNNEEEDNEIDTSLTIKEMKKQIKKQMKSNIIYKYMNVYNLITYECPYKNHENNIYNIESDSNITFHLENILQNRSDKKSEITLEECFKFVQEMKINNKFYCSKCKKVVTGDSFEKILFPPEILIIILNRGKGKKVKNKVKVNRILDISDFIHHSNKKKNDIYYKLIGSCNHYGDSSPTGHYTACCLFEDGFYYQYNDKNVKCYKNYQYIGEPYILFYHRQLIKNYHVTKNNIQNEMNWINNSNNLSNEENQKYENILNEVFRRFEYYHDYYIIYQNDIFIWEVTKKGKTPLIMDFSNPPEYNLLDITTVKGSNTNIREKINVDFLCNMDLSLEENIEYIYEKISIYLNKVFKVYNKERKKCCINCLIF